MYELANTPISFRADAYLDRIVSISDLNRGKPVRVIHVDDEPDFAELVKDYIERDNPQFEVETATEASSALERIRDNGFECIVCDYEMPEVDGLDLLEAVRTHFPELPFILFTGKGSEEIASDAISAGVSDYLQKRTGTEQYSLLANRIDNLVSQYRAEAQLARWAQQQKDVADLGRQALAGDSLDNLFESALDALVETLGVDYAKVLEYRPETDDLLLISGLGWHEETVGQATVGTGDDSQAGHTLWSEEPIVVKDLQTEERFHGPQLLEEHDVVSGISVVVGNPADPWGVLGAHTRTETEFTEDDVRFVQNIANVLASAIERSSSDQLLLETHSWYEKILEYISDYVIVIDESAEISYVSPAVEHMLGYDPDELVGTSALDYVHRDDSELAAEAFTKTISEPSREVTVEFRTRAADDSYRWIEARGRSYLDDEDIGGLLVSVRDISDRKERQLDL